MTSPPRATGWGYAGKSQKVNSFSRSLCQVFGPRRVLGFVSLYEQVQGFLRFSAAWYALRNIFLACGY
jgi:hypothetical protein